MKTINNTIFISGGSAGIGLAIAKKLNENNKVIINGRNPERLQKALAQLPNTVGMVGDLSVQADRVRIAHELQTNHPDLNIIVNNAGAPHGYLLSNATNAHEKALDEMMTNYIAIIHFTELLLPHLLQKEAAAIVNVSSIAIYRGNINIPTYSASKAALHSYTATLRDTLKEHANLGVYELMPPLVDTDFSAGIGGKTNGIPASEVAEELAFGLENNQFEIPVGMTKIFREAVSTALSNIGK